MLGVSYHAAAFLTKRIALCFAWNGGTFVVCSSFKMVGYYEVIHMDGRRVVGTMHWEDINCNSCAIY